MTKDGIDCCRRIGRDVENNRTTIGLAELDALCAAADAGVEMQALYEYACRREHNAFNPRGDTAHAGHSFDNCRAAACVEARKNLKAVR